LDSVLIEGLEVEAVIGVLDWEREVDQRLVVDLELGWDNRRAAATDDLADALDYAAVSERGRDCLVQGRFQLLETAAEVVSTDLARHFGITRRVITIRKPGAVPAAGAVGVRIERGEH